MKKRMMVVLMMALGMALMAANPGRLFAKTFKEFCQRSFQETGQCPTDVCQLEKLTTAKDKTSEPGVCVPQKCVDIEADKCPADYCEVMENCSKEKICHYKMAGGKPKCGSLAYAGQDVPCCKGLVQRCGIEFMDATCDMEGKNSMYSLPICIPCGDGVCGNFENRCNCPEDCGVPPKGE